MYNEDMHFSSLQRKLKKVPFISFKSLDCSIKHLVFYRKKKRRKMQIKDREKNRIKCTTHKIHGIRERAKENMGFKMLFEDVYQFCFSTVEEQQQQKLVHQFVFSLDLQEQPGVPALRQLFYNAVEARIDLKSLYCMTS